MRLQHSSSPPYLLKFTYVVTLGMFVTVMLMNMQNGSKQRIDSKTRVRSNHFEKSPEISRTSPEQSCSCPSSIFSKSEFEIGLSIRRNWSKSIPFVIEDSLNNPEAEGHRRFDMLGPVSPKCKVLEKYGVGDDEKRACGLKRLLRNQTDCLIISLGSNNQWNFEEHIFRHFSHCVIHTFDCTLERQAKPPAGIAARTTLHRLCVADADAEADADGRAYLSWASLLQRINASRPPRYLKMDVEGFEYGILRNIVDDGRLLPDQIAFEMHLHTNVARFPWGTRGKTPAEVACTHERGEGGGRREGGKDGEGEIHVPTDVACLPWRTRCKRLFPFPHLP